MLSVLVHYLFLSINPLTLFYTITLHIYQMCIVYKISYKNEHILVYKHNFFQSEN